MAVRYNKGEESNEERAREKTGKNSLYNAARLKEWNSRDERNGGMGNTIVGPAFRKKSALQKWAERMM